MLVCRRSPPARSRVRTGHAGGGEAIPRRALGGVRLGRPLRLQGCSGRRLKKRRTGGPEYIRPPATTSRARPKGARAPRRPLLKGAAPQRVPEERWSRRLEAPRPMRPGRENRGDATGRPNLKFLRRPLLAFFKAGVRLGRSPGVDSARPNSPDPSPFFGDAHAGNPPTLRRAGARKSEKPRCVNPVALHEEGISVAQRLRA